MPEKNRKPFSRRRDTMTFRIQDIALRTKPHYRGALRRVEWENGAIRKDMSREERKKLYDALQTETTRRAAIRACRAFGITNTQERNNIIRALNKYVHVSHELQNARVIQTFFDKKLKMELKGEKNSPLAKKELEKIQKKWNDAVLEVYELCGNDIGPEFILLFNESYTGR